MPERVDEYHDRGENRSIQKSASRKAEDGEIYNSDVMMSERILAVRIGMSAIVVFVGLYNFNT